MSQPGGSRQHREIRQGTFRKRVRRKRTTLLRFFFSQVTNDAITGRANYAISRKDDRGHPRPTPKNRRNRNPAEPRVLIRIRLEIPRFKLIPFPASLFLAKIDLSKRLRIYNSINSHFFRSLSSRVLFEYRVVFAIHAFPYIRSKHLRNLDSRWDIRRG